MTVKSNEEFPEIQKCLRRESDKELMKEAMREAAKEWLNEQYRAFGKWTAVGIAAGAFILLVKILVIGDYWPN